MQLSFLSRTLCRMRRARSTSRGNSSHNPLSPDPDQAWWTAASGTSSCPSKTPLQRPTPTSRSSTGTPPRKSRQTCTKNCRSARRPPPPTGWRSGAGRQPAPPTGARLTPPSSRRAGSTTSCTEEGAILLPPARATCPRRRSTRAPRTVTFLHTRAAPLATGPCPTTRATVLTPGGNTCTSPTA